MTNGRPIEIAAIVGALLSGAIFFVWMAVHADAVPVEYRNTSPGYGWTWDFDWMTALRDAGRFGEDPRPWPAKAVGGSLVLPLDQPLMIYGLEITYKGMSESGDVRLDIVVQSLDSAVAYPRNIGGLEARDGFMISDRSFRMEHITPLYLRLSSDLH